MSRSARARSTLAPKRFRTTAALFLALSTAGFMAQPAIGGTAAPALFSARAASVPPAPKNLVANATSSTKIALKWAASQGAAFYKAQHYRPNQGIWFTFAQPKATSTVSQDLTPGRSYQYRVIAVNSAGASRPSNVAEGKTLEEPPPPPEPECNDGADNDGDGKVDLADPGCESSTDTSEAPDPPPPPPTVNCPAGGQQIYPTDNLVAAVNDTGTTPETFCLEAGVHNIGSSILYPDPGDTFIGVTATMVGVDVQASSKIVGTGFFIFGAEGTAPANVTMEHLDISGAMATPEQCDANYGGFARCGSGIKWGANFVGRYLDVHDNVNQGIGGGGAGGSLLEFVELHHNGSPVFCCGSYASSAGVKTTAHYTIQDSWVHHNDGSGVWCDVFCKGPATMLVQRNVIADNSKHGIHYEISYGPIIVRNNLIQRNAQGETRPVGGGVSITDSRDVTVESNTFGGNGYHGLSAHSTNRPPGLQNVNFHANRLNGDVVKGCEQSVVTCSNNS